MTKTWNKRLLLVSVLLLVIFVALITPVAATTTMTVDLAHDYQFRHTNLSHIMTLDLWNPANSTVEIQTTSGDNTDVRVIQQPRINTLTRNFSSDNGTFNGNTVHIVGPLDSTIDYRPLMPLPADRYYITPSVPTFKVTVPEPGGLGGYIGNPVAVNYNESWATSGATGGSIFNASNIMYMYNSSGILYANILNPPNTYNAYGNIDTALTDKNNLDFTLNNNLVSLNPYTGDATTSSNMGGDFPAEKAGTGRYFVGALRHDEATCTTTILALTPLVALNEETPISWTDDYGTHSLPMTYVKGQMGDVTLKFANSNPPPTKIGYLFVNSTAQYNMRVHIDMSKLAETTDDTWQTLTPSAHMTELLYEGILQNEDSPFTYNLSAVGYAIPTESTSYSRIAITPGYGLSGNAATSQITIPQEAFASLNDGVYYAYLMGLNDKNETVALSQTTVNIKSGYVPEPISPTISGIAPLSGPRNTTISFTLSGTNFPAALGPSGVNVNLTKYKNTTITTNIISVSSTQIKGTFDTDYQAVNGPWDVVLTTNDAGQTVKTSAFTIVNTPKPVITAVKPVSAFQNTTIYFTITGTFPLTTDVTAVNFTQGSYFERNVTINSITATSINGTLAINKTAPFGKWNVNVQTTDVGTSNTMAGAFTVNNVSTPAITAIKPVSAFQNTTIYFTLTGTGFPTGSDMTTV
ncbi:MAG: hypothetical protein ABSG49_11695, partial [Methanoregula sp.]|uniref:hypothetical protein n=1 Tax=Methanoregula sp. TaxID=2052170 RepID=UPI003C274208